MSNRSNLVDVGRIATVFGVSGWVKIRSYTQTQENIFDYQPWWLKTRHGVKAVEVGASKAQGKGMLAHIKGIDTLEAAREICQVNIAVERNQLPSLEEDEFYWHQLEGLQVISEFEGQTYAFGPVQRLMETGANDVLVVKGEDGSIDQRERLIPYVPGQYVKSVDLTTKEIRVDWDPEF